ncbi:cell division transport system permease protein [Methylohalomonas lacus]|uniref:Cell division protein FtsX n=1 Tax=Methylohalomonas lacus TaxID=398773 RepID=A0AAE3HLR1_9GAMM|nr:permease-like cell division protein FtsX [Methylohalomonas lacus]MCS3903307.1 cell division transport system permease protein [Methylohalomonas lacus]
MKNRFIGKGKSERREKPRSRRGGASRRRYFGERIKDGGKVWLLQHMQAAVFSFGQLARNPFGSIMTIAVIGIALALPAGFYLILDNTQRVASGFDTTLQIATYLKLDTSAERAAHLAAELRADEAIGAVEYISRDEALSEFRERSGFSDAIDALRDNPLPALLLVQPAGNARDTAAYNNLLKRLRGMPEVDQADFDHQWLQRLQAIIETVQRAVLVLSVVLGMAVLLIVGNTIRLGIFNRRAEIEITKLFGATDAFIQRPFLYTGFWYGLLGAIFAWLLITAAVLFLRGPVQDLASLYASDYRLRAASLLQLLALFGCGVGLGLAGSWIAVQRHIKAIEPA